MMVGEGRAANETVSPHAQRALAPSLGNPEVLPGRKTPREEQCWIHPVILRNFVFFISDCAGTFDSTSRTRSVRLAAVNGFGKNAKPFSAAKLSLPGYPDITKTLVPGLSWRMLSASSIPFMLPPHI